MRKLYSYLAMGVIVSALLATAEAQVPCDQRGKLVHTLLESYREVEIGQALTPGGQLLEIFASPGGTWTILLSLPTGKSCLIAAGENWDLRGARTHPAGQGI